MINVWTYWVQGKNKIDELGRICINTWYYNLKDNFKINILDRKYFLEIQNEYNEDYLNKLSYQQEADLVRLYLLYNYGGIWIDIHIIITNNLDWVIDKYNKGYKQVGFYIQYLNTKKDTKNILENWFIAVKDPKNYIIKCWKETFENILKESIENKNIENFVDINSKIVNETNINELSPIFNRDNYLSMHIALLYCLQNNLKFKSEFNKTIYLYDGRQVSFILNSVDNILYTLTNGIGYNMYNLPLIKISSKSKYLLKYYSNEKLKNLIKKNNSNKIDYFDDDYLINLILIIIFIFIFFFINYLLNSNKIK